MRSNTDITTHALVITLKSHFGGSKRTKEVSFLTDISERTIRDIYARAISGGFDPNKRPINIENEYLANAPRSGRPTMKTEENQKFILDKVRL